MPTLSGLAPAQQALAQRRGDVLRPHVQDGVPLARAARDAQVPLRTAQRWLVRYRAGGLAALARLDRSDRGARRLPPINDLTVITSGVVEAARSTLVIGDT